MAGARPDPRIGRAPPFSPHTMNDLHYIIALMRTETDALGFIPRAGLWNRIVRKHRYLIQTDGHGFRRGYLLHGPPLPDQPLRIYQACIDLDHRRIKYATEMVHRLITRAGDAGSSEILLRCAADLPANSFWQASGFHVVRILPGGSKRRRIIHLYRLPAGQFTR